MGALKIEFIKFAVAVFSAISVMGTATGISPKVLPDVARSHDLLSSSSWPLCHGDAHATDTSSFLGPDPAGTLEAQLVVEYPSLWSRVNTFLPVSLVFDHRFIWGTSVTSTLVFEVDAESSQLKLVDSFDNGRYDWSYHGAYSFVSSQGSYFSSTQRGFNVFAVSKSTASPRIMKRGEFFLGPSSAAEGGLTEVVVGVLPLYPAAAAAKDDDTCKHAPTENDMLVSASSGTSEDHERVDINDIGGGESSVHTCAKPGSISGYVAVATSTGRLLVVAHLPGPFGDDFNLVASLTLPRSSSAPHAFVSNSFSVDASGGIYVVSAEAMHRAQWTPPKARTSCGGRDDSADDEGNDGEWRGGLKHSWTTPYSSATPPRSSSTGGSSGSSDDGDTADTAREAAQPPLWPGRLGRGSGSTPSLMMGRGLGQPAAAASSSSAGTSPQPPTTLPSFVVVTDGASPMRFLVFRTRDGACVGNATVQFGQQGGDDKKKKGGGGGEASPKQEPLDSQSEQSVVVSGNKAVVVQNWLPPHRVPFVCAALLASSSSSSSSPFFFLKGLLPGKLVTACAFLLGAAPLSGVEQLEVDLDSGEVVGTAWVNKEVQCASSIPAASIPLPLAAATAATPPSLSSPPSAVFYCLGMRPRVPSSSSSSGGLAKRLLGHLGLLPKHEFVVEALHWSNGTRVHPAFPVGSGALFNPAYAAVQIGAKRDLVMGTMGGVLRVTSSAAAAAPITGASAAAAAAASTPRSSSASASLLTVVCPSSAPFVSCAPARAVNALGAHLGMGSSLALAGIALAAFCASALLLASCVVRRCLFTRSSSAQRGENRGLDATNGGSSSSDESNETVESDVGLDDDLPPRGTATTSVLLAGNTKVPKSSTRAPVGSPSVSSLKNTLRGEQEARAAARVASGVKRAPASDQKRGKRPKLSLAFESN